LPSFSRAAQSFVPPLAGALRELNPLVAYLAPYSRELSVFLGLNGAVTSSAT
jgi:hypothetical protein